MLNQVKAWITPSTGNLYELLAPQMSSCVQLCTSASASSWSDRPSASSVPSRPSSKSRAISSGLGTSAHQSVPSGWQLTLAQILAKLSGLILARGLGSDLRAQGSEVPGCRAGPGASGGLGSGGFCEPSAASCLAGAGGCVQGRWSQSCWAPWHRQPSSGPDSPMPSPHQSPRS